MKASFIAIDGIDGAGKSTQTARLVKWLRDMGYPCEESLEPGGTEAGKRIREILLDKSIALTPEAELLLFSADRAEHQKKVMELLGSGVSVVTDRFLSSTWAYQVFGRGLASELLEAVIPYTVKRLPDISIILTIKPEFALERARRRLKAAGKLDSEGRFEAEGTQFFEAVQEGFKWYADCGRFGSTAVIDVSGLEDGGSAIIQGICKERLGI